MGQRLHRISPTVQGLSRSCHRGPALAVTLLAGLLTAAAGGTAVRALLVAAVFLVGQVSIGWSNDWIDADRDIATGRSDKPVATGALPREVVGRAAMSALVASVPLSYTLGWVAGSSHLVAVASGWSYNLGLKRTIWSWLPYAVTFGLLPVVVVYAIPGSGSPQPWVVAAGSLLGIGAHLTNVLPDLEDDLATGVRGLPHRIGRPATVLCASITLGAASVVVVLGTRRSAGTSGSPGTGGYQVAALIAVLALVLASCIQR